MSAFSGLEKRKKAPHPVFCRVGCVELSTTRLAGVPSLKHQMNVSNPASLVCLINTRKNPLLMDQIRRGSRGNRPLPYSPSR